MRLPNAEHAVVDLRKLRDYCLNPDHEVGKHKARVFREVFGWTRDDADTLRDSLLAAAQTHDATVGGSDVHGARYEVDFVLDGATAPATICSAWIVRRGEDYPRLVSCRVARRRR